jgi:hypothetical protein
LSVVLTNNQNVDIKFSAHENMAHIFHFRFLFLDFITSFPILSNAGNINVVSDIITPDIVEQFGSILNRRREICGYSAAILTIIIQIGALICIAPGHQYYFSYIIQDNMEQFGSILNRRRAVPAICPHSKIAICKNNFIK